MTVAQATKHVRKGVSINLFDGVKRREWVIVEYDDGTASIHGDWDDAMKAGDFDTEAALQATQRELDQLIAELQPDMATLDRDIAELSRAKADNKVM